MAAATDARIYAEDTKVPVLRSREEIAGLLRAWRCDAIQWSDDYAEGTMQLRFRWAHEGVSYTARMGIKVPTAAEVRRTMAKDRAGKPPTDRQVVDAHCQAERAAHRLLALKLKADLNCVRAGLFSVIDVLLPHIERADGQTVAEVAAPLLAAHLTGRMRPLLPG